MKKHDVLKFYVSFSDVFPPGCKHLHFLSSDSDSSSKTVYIATWVGLESQIWAKIHQINKKTKYFY